MQVQLLLRVQVQLLLRLLLATTIATSISGITRRANRYSTQIAAVYLHVADRYSTSTSGITRRANRYSTQIAAVLACSRPLFDKHQRYNAKREPFLFQSGHEVVSNSRLIKTLPNQSLPSRLVTRTIHSLPYRSVA